MSRIKPTIESTSSEFEERGCENERASDCFEPITKLLKLCGSFSDRPVKNGKRVWTCHYVYCFVVQLLMFGMMVRYMTVFRHGISQLYKTVGLIGYLYYYAIVTTYSMTNLYSNCNHLSIFLNGIDKYCHQYGMCFNITKRKHVHRKIVVTSSLIIVVSALIGIPFIIVSYEGQDVLITANFSPFDREEGLVFILAVAVIGSTSPLYILILASNLIYLLVSLHILTREFKTISHKLKQSLAENQPINLDTLRQQHEDIIGLVNTGNPMFRHVAAISYAYGIPISCVMLYGTTVEKLNITDTMAMISVVICAVVGMFAITFIGANLNDAVSFINVEFTQPYGSSTFSF